MKKFAIVAVVLIVLLAGFTLPAFAQNRFQQWKEDRAARQESKSRVESGPTNSVSTEIFEGRKLLVHVPLNLSPSGKRALVIVLHGGMGNAGHIQSGIGMDDVADKYGFIVAYPDGTPVTRGDDRFHGWNAGICCGQPALNKIDDVAYLTKTVSYLAQKYGIDKGRVYGMGHSNGAMMTQRLMCETDLYQAAMPFSGTLGLNVTNCPPAKGKKIMAVHGALDENVPITGGKGTKGISRTNFKSEAYTKKIFEFSGATYTLDIVQGADHNLLNIDKALKARDGKGVSEKAADFFGLTGESKTP